MLHIQERLPPGDICEAREIWESRCTWVQFYLDMRIFERNLPISDSEKLHWLLVQILTHRHVKARLLNIVHVQKLTQNFFFKMIVEKTWKQVSWVRSAAVTLKTGGELTPSSTYILSLGSNISMALLSMLAKQCMKESKNYFVV